MTNPQDPNDPGSLSLKPSLGGAKKPDFSNVQGSADTVAGRSGGGGGSGSPDFSNVRGGSDTVPGNAGGGGGGGEQTYTVASGDTLSHISQRFYGKASRWNAIYEANRDQLDDPDRIKPGQVLRIPAAQD